MIETDLLARLLEIERTLIRIEAKLDQQLERFDCFTRRLERSALDFVDRTEDR